MKCLHCNKNMTNSGNRRGRLFCVHRMGKYISIIYDDGLVRVLVGDLFLIEMNDFSKLNEEYIGKMIMLI